MSIKVCSIGDIMLGENVHHYGRGITTRYQGAYHRLVPPWVSEVLNGADLVVGNLECSLIADEALRRAPIFRAVYAAPESALSCFEGLRPPLVLNVANNHFGQHGTDAMAYTLGCLRRRGIYVIGRDRWPLELAFGQYRVHLLGVSLVKDSCEDGYLKSTPERLLRDLTWCAKPEGTFRVLSIHWGEEYRTLPSADQERLAWMLAQSGVDLILGHHPHVVQPVQLVGGTTVAYSHGNFLFDQNFSGLTRTGLILTSDVDGQGKRIFLSCSRNYRIHRLKALDVAGLMRFCRQHMNRRSPLLMRIWMKLEMIANAHEVPWTVWRYFGDRLMEKCFEKAVQAYWGIFERIGGLVHRCLK